jgi:hypothetical protein
MTLLKTVIHPDTDPESKLQEPVLKMVILGNKTELVATADYLAEEPPTEVDRWVIWYKNPDMKALKKKFPVLKNMPEFKAFSLSTINKVADVITVNDLEDELRVEKAYTKAGLRQYNQ